MRELGILIKFEYIKLFKKRSTWIILLLLLAAGIFGSVEMLIGNDTNNGLSGTNYENMIKYKKNALALSGGKIDTELIGEVKQANLSYLERTVNVRDVTKLNQIYKETIEPYESIMPLLSVGYTGDYEATEFLAHLTEENMDNFYPLLLERQKQYLKSDYLLTKTEQEKLIEYQAKIDIPFSYSYDGGWQRIRELLDSYGLIFFIFGISICIAPIFSGEYSNKMDSLILSTKYGKQAEIWAKLIMAFSFTFFVSVIYLLIQLAVVLMIYGTSGANNPIQLILKLKNVVYPLDNVELTIIYIVCVVCATLLSTAITCVLSSKMKTSFSAIIISFMLTIIPVLVQIPEKYRILNKIYSLLPSRMIQSKNIFPNYMYGIGKWLTPAYHFIPLFCILAAAGLAVIAFRGFRNHQVA